MPKFRVRPGGAKIKKRYAPGKGLVLFLVDERLVNPLSRSNFSYFWFRSESNPEKNRHRAAANAMRNANILQEV